MCIISLLNSLKFLSFDRFSNGSESIRDDLDFEHGKKKMGVANWKSIPNLYYLYPWLLSYTNTKSACRFTLLQCLQLCR